MTLKYNHTEAFCLMWYGCKCGHRERIWNSRDGVAPFGMGCPSCGSAMNHVDWAKDILAPQHQLNSGQRFFRDGTPDEAEAIMLKRIEQSRLNDEKQISELIKHARDEGEGGEFQKGWPTVEVHQ